VKIPLEQFDKPSSTVLQGTLSGVYSTRDKEDLTNIKSLSFLALLI
jgi:hypothetical protein